MKNRWEGNTVFFEMDTLSAMGEITQRVMNLDKNRVEMTSRHDGFKKIETENTVKGFFLIFLDFKAKNCRNLNFTFFGVFGLST